MTELASQGPEPLTPVAIALAMRERIAKGWTIVAAILLAGCLSPEAHRSVFVAEVSAAVDRCARHGAPRVCPEADRLAALYWLRHVKESR